MQRSIADFSRPDTFVLKIRVLKPQIKAPEPTKLKFVFQVPGNDLHDAASKVDGSDLVLLWFTRRLLCVPLANLLNASRLGGNKNRRPKDDDPPMIKALPPSTVGYTEGFAFCTWWFIETSSKCQEWARRFEVTEPRLEEGLYHRLIEVALATDGKRWASELHELSPGK